MWYRSKPSISLCVSFLLFNSILLQGNWADRSILCSYISHAPIDPTKLDRSIWRIERWNVTEFWEREREREIEFEYPVMNIIQLSGLWRLSGGDRWENYKWSPIATCSCRTPLIWVLLFFRSSCVFSVPLTVLVDRYTLASAVARTGKLIKAARFLVWNTDTKFDGDFGFNFFRPDKKNQGRRMIMASSSSFDPPRSSFSFSKVHFMMPWYICTNLILT